MNKIYRLCAHCGRNGPIEADHCPHCGYNRLKESDIPKNAFDNPKDHLPAKQNSLPAKLAKAALPVLVGAAGIAARAGWQLIQSRLTAAAHQQSIDKTLYPNKSGHSPLSRKQQSTQGDVARNAAQSIDRRPRHTIHIRSQWAVGDANGQWRRGASEHTIEIE